MHKSHEILRKFYSVVFIKETGRVKGADMLSESRLKTVKETKLEIKKKDIETMTSWTNVL